MYSLVIIKSLDDFLPFHVESAVNAVCWAGKEERFLLVAEHSGYLHTVHVKSERVINCERVYQTFNDVSSTVTQLLYAEDACKLFRVSRCSVIVVQYLYIVAHYQYIVFQYIVVQYLVVQYIVVKYRVFQYMVVQYIGVQYHYIVVQYIVV